MGQNDLIESGTSPARSRVAGFWPVNEGDLQQIEVPMADTATHAKGTLIIGHTSGYGVIAASNATSVNVLGVCAYGAGNATANANDNVKMQVWIFDCVTLYWVIASTGAAAVTDFPTCATIDGGDGISADGTVTAGAGSVGFRIVQIDDTYDICLGHFIIS